MEPKKKETANCCDTKSGCCSSGCCGSKCCNHSAMHCIIKTIIIVIIIGLVIGAGHAAFRKFGRSYGTGYYGMMSQISTVDGKTAYGPGMMTNFGGCEFGKYMKFWGDDENEKNKATKLFGLVTKVEGNKITVLDNGGKEQVVLSLSSTTIFNSIGEIGIASIKEGQGLSVMGKENTDKQIEAVMIRIM